MALDLTFAIIQLKMVIHSLRTMARDLEDLHPRGSHREEVAELRQSANDLTSEMHYIRDEFCVTDIPDFPLRDEPPGVRWFRVFEVFTKWGEHCQGFSFNGVQHEQCPYYRQQKCNLGTAKGHRPEMCPGYIEVKLNERKEVKHV